MKLHNLNGRTKEGYTTWGAVWEKGRCTGETTYGLYNEDGKRLPMQSHVTAWWQDGSVKWTAHTAEARLLDDIIEVRPLEERSMKEQMDRDSVSIHKIVGKRRIQAGCITLDIPDSSGYLFQNLCVGGCTVISDASARLTLEHPSDIKAGTSSIGHIKTQTHFDSTINRVELIEKGPLRIVIRYEGVHTGRGTNENKLPFIIYMKIGLNSRKLDFVHTFLYDGVEETDHLKGIGIMFHIPLKGEIYNRHVKFEGEFGCFHEAAAPLLSWRPRIPEHVYSMQMRGKKLSLCPEDLDKAEQILPNMPHWSEFEFCQDSPSHFSVRKKIRDENCCYLDCLDGTRTGGAASIGSEHGSILFSIRDFWEKYPSGYTFKNLDGDVAEATVWLWPPKSEAMDFRHYANRGYNQVHYEGYDFKGATPYGIACTSEFSIGFSEGVIPEDEEIHAFSEMVNRPAQYVGEPEYYYRLHAFGRWSLPGKATVIEDWLERQLQLAVDFYVQEVGQRNWYGMFNYGDFMHTYDAERHQWRYDMGGYAWDNTELVPTLWLWLMFMRTGREDVFTLAEKLSRHASEVDIYHMGDLKGLGSRHNVRHWGCPCKEARIAMAGHHRCYYYLTGDHRMGEIFEELKDNEMSFLNKDPLEMFYDKEDMVFPSHARTGPDWSSLCSNWMTRWERFGDNDYKRKIVTGIEDIKKAPLRLVSGPDFEFDPTTVHLRYIGECAAGGTHLQICMGAPQIWMELADWLEDEEWKRMLAEYGRFYFLDREQQMAESGGIIGEREFSLPFMATAMGAFGAEYFKDEKLAKTVWRHLLGAMIQAGNWDGFRVSVVKNRGNRERLIEIPWISTNFAAQWCLNVMISLEFIKDSLPKEVQGAEGLLADFENKGFRKA